MDRVAHYLQEHLVGEVMTSADARRYFSTDGSILNIEPSIIVYPRNENDVRKTARFCWQLAERGRALPITARGSGTDLGGGAIGSGIMLVFPAHMNKILVLDQRKNQVTIQPGINYDKLQQTLHTHGMFLPPYPTSLQFSTVGGAIANNASGEKSVKYGVTREFVDSLRVVLANGEVITTFKLTRRELNRKMGLTSFEGEIYRQMDALIKDNWEVIEAAHKRMQFTKNTAGYNLYDIKDKRGNFDLTPLFAGSQGTLGIISEASLRIEPFNPATTLLIASFDDLEKAAQAIRDIRSMDPSTVEFVDDNLLNYIVAHNPNQLKGVVEQPFAKATLLIEFDDIKERQQHHAAKKAKKMLGKYAVDVKVSHDPDEQERYWKIRRGAATVLWQSEGGKKALPLIEDAVVPPEKFMDLVRQVYRLFEFHGMQPALWGHAGDGQLRVHPMLNLSLTGDRQKIFRILDDYSKLVISLGGTPSGAHGDGRIRAPFLRQLFGGEMYELFEQVKKIFDPHGVLNPGVKVGVTTESLIPMLRKEYSMDHLYDHMPHN